MLLPSIPRRRSGFTLIELLVVIAIIAVLVSLLSAGIFYAYVRMAETGARNDVSQLAQSMQAFKAKYGVYPPSPIRLCGSRSQYTASPSPYDTASIAFINQVWPNINWVNIKWDGQNANLDVLLDGDQVLVYFLAGIPVNGPGSPGSGFSTNGKDPSTPGGSRVGPFYDFPGGRLFPRNVNNTFLSYRDYYGNEPYIYFGAGNRMNGYLPGYFININDTNNNSANVFAYYSSTGFYNPDSFQIICAGRNGAFNSTGANNTRADYLWTPQTGTGMSPAGIDDLTNFYDSRLGVPQ